MLILGSPFQFAVPNLIDQITSLGLTTSLQLCLDAGDANSYTSGQTWTDVSGNSNNFFRGSGSGSESADPTFNGVAGGRSSSEYFSGDGLDTFWNTAKHTFPASWHKDGATFTVAGWVYIPSGGSLFMMSNFFDTAQRGVAIFIQPLSGSGRPTVQMARADSGPSVQTLGSAASDYIVENAWMFAGVSFSEGSGQSFGFANGTANLFSSDSYTSPSASDPNFGMALWSDTNAAGTGPDTDPAFIADSGTRMAALLAWNRALAQAEIADLYNATKSKFGL